MNKNINDLFFFVLIVRINVIDGVFQIEIDVNVMVNITMSQQLASSSASSSPLVNRTKTNERDASSTNSIVFQSNLACVLNDPKKTRAEISTFFTQTWGKNNVSFLSIN